MAIRPRHVRLGAWLIARWGTLLALAVASGFCFAAPVSEDRAELVAANWMLYRTGVEHAVVETVAGPVAAHLTKASDARSPMHYRFNLEPEGWVIVAADDVAFPILGYSPTGAIEAGDVASPAFTSWMRNLDGEIQSAVRASKTPQGAHRLLSEDEAATEWAIFDAWEFLEQIDLEALRAEEEVRAVAPLLKTKWDQGKYYNAMCPLDNRVHAFYDGRVPAGCGAIALAQLMKYHAHPARGAGAHSYRSAYGVLSANFGATTYNWSGMPAALTSHNANVATIIYHAGIALEMNYGPSGSSAFTNMFGKALREHFGYQASDLIGKDGQFSNAQWEQKIDTELAARAPIIYRGANSANTSAHYWVLDGSDGSGLYHFNWGWGGRDDGYFKLSGATALGNDYSNHHWALFGARSGTTAKPATPALISPTGAIADSTPTYRWTGASNATSYQLLVRRGSTTVVKAQLNAATAGCNGGTSCAYTPTQALGSGDYRWWVAAWNSKGWSSWSTPRSFSLGTSSRAGWGALNDVYCRDRSPLTFRVTVEGTRRYSTARGPNTATWQGWAYTNQGYKTVDVAIYGSCTNTITGTLRNYPIGAGKRTLLVLGYDSAQGKFVIRSRTYAGVNSLADSATEGAELQPLSSPDASTIEYRFDVDDPTGLSTDQEVELPIELP